MSLQEHNYSDILKNLAEKIRQARVKAVLTVNLEMLKLYWEIGNTILLQQEEGGWGAKVIDTLSADLKTEFPDFRGLSVRNLKYMRVFAEAYPDFPFVQMLSAQMENTENKQDIIVQSPAAQITWSHHQLILEKVKNHDERLFYIQKSAENRWSRNVLAAQIESNLFGRQGNALTNFPLTLPPAASDLAQETFKNPYIFDFITLSEEMKERDLENAMVQHLKKFMLELGKGFAFVGNQFNLSVEGDDYFLDLLFFNINLQCYVVFELKLGEFKPEFAGKLNFYINTIDAQIKGAEHKPTIGILLCKTPNDTVVKFALQGIQTPMGISEYQLADALPKQLKGELPSIEELEAEIEKEYQELKSPVDKRLDSLKEKIGRLKGEEIKTIANYEILCSIYDRSLKPLYAALLQKFEEFDGLFYNHDCYWTGPNNITTLDQVEKYWKEENFLKNNHEFNFAYRLRGLIKAGPDGFDVFMDLRYRLDTYNYNFSIVNLNNSSAFLKKGYHEQLTPEDMQLIIDNCCNVIMDQIEQEMERLSTKK